MTPDEQKILEDDERHERVADLVKRFWADGMEGGYAEVEIAEACMKLIVWMADGDPLRLLTFIHGLCAVAQHYEEVKPEEG